MQLATRRSVWLALLLTLAAAAPHAAAATPPPAVAARSAALYDPRAGRLLYGKNADRHARIASLTKIMTAWLALKHPAGETIDARPDVLAMPQTKAGLVPGHSYTLGQLLPVLIARSANDAAVAIADGLSGSVPAFVGQMNATARALGLKNTRYANPSGLDAPGEYSSARDTAVLAGLAMEDPAFRRLAGLHAASLPGGPTFYSLNPFLAAYPGADGVKTGFTSDAGFCLAASAVHGSRRLIAVMLGEPSFAVADSDAAHLLDWGFAHDPAPRAAASTRATPPSPARGTGAAAVPAPASPPTAPAPPRAPAAAGSALQPAPEATRPAVHRPAAAVQIPVRPALLLGSAFIGLMLGIRSLHRSRRAAGRSRRRTPAR